MKKIMTLTLSAVLLAAVFSACSSQSDRSVERAVSNAFSSLQKYNEADIQSWISSDDLSSLMDSAAAFDGGDEMMQAMFADLSYEITDIEVDEDEENATAELKITNKNFQDATTDFMAELTIAFMQGQTDFSSAAYNEEQITAFTEMLQDEEISTTIFNVKLSLKKVDDNWMLYPNDNVLTAWTGDAYSSAKSLFSLTQSTASGEDDA
ncbi:MAG: hypothetical protein LIO46_01615 [Clostridiales bacterium]|nr:hypothetical protein [Clostridiales bacterium]